MSLNTNIQNVLFVFVGGGIGCVLRYFISLLGSSFSTTMPISTFIANILGCFVIGFLFTLCSLVANFSQEMKLFIMVGLCGGLTTFSTFSLELVALMNQSKIFALCYAFCSVFCCLIAVILGMWLGEVVLKNGI